MKKLKVLALAHSTSLPPEDATAEASIGKPWKMEFYVLEAIRRLGHELQTLTADDELVPIRRAITEWKPDVVFNLLESFDGEVLHDQNVVGYLELLRAPYTGCNPRGMVLSRDKALSKKIASYHRIRTPGFVVFHRGRRVRKPRALEYPLIVKSLIDDASLGIARASIVDTDEKLEERVRYVQESWNVDVIAEEFIAGREVYVGVLGNTRLQVLPTWELLFENAPDAPLVATAKVKWDPAYQKKLGVNTRSADDLDEDIARRIPRVTRRLYRALSLSGYARIDYRISREGELYFLEANPNPDISRDEDLAMSAAAAGIEYEALIGRILRLGTKSL